MQTTQSLTDVKQLEEIANDFLKKNFSMKLTVPIRICNRITMVAGYLRTVNDEPAEVVISGNLIKYYTTAEVIETLKHECVHYALLLLNKPYEDGDEYFENTLKQLGLTAILRYKGKAHVYRCTGCNHNIRRIRRFNVARYQCSGCKGRFEYVREVLIK